MILKFVYRGRSVVIDDSPAGHMDHPAGPMAPKPTGPHGDGHSGHGHPPDGNDPHSHDPHAGHDDPGGHQHGAIQIRIDDRTVFADRVPSGYFFMTHELPFRQFATIDALVKAVIDLLDLGKNHGRPKESK
jgi:hypothetical protein